MAKIGVYAGAFDPFTIGHADIVRRVLPLVDQLHIVFGHNILKHTFQPLEKRLHAVSALYKGEDKVVVTSYDGIIAKYAQELDAVLIRGIRGVADLNAEQTLADINRLHYGIETICLFAEPSQSFVSSSLVRELAAFGEDYSEYIPKIE